MAQLLDDYLDGRTVREKRAGVRAEETTAARATALAIHAAYDRRAPRPKDPLLRSLCEAVAAFDASINPDDEGS